SPELKRLLQAASVIGKDVPFALLLSVAELSEEELRRGLGALQAAEFLYETRLFPDLEYTFKHALTHAVTYGGLLQERSRTPGSGMRSRRSTGTASASRWSGSPITRCTARCGRRRCPISGRPGSRRPAVARFRKRGSGSRKRWAS